MSSDQEPQPAFAPLSTKDLQRFKHSSWHSQFRSHTPKTSILPLTPQFIEWLEEDGIVLPLGSESAIEKAEEYEEELQEDEEPSWSFPELDRRIRAVLDKYDGAVFPKFDFSAPQVDFATLLIAIACVAFLTGCFACTGRFVDVGEPFAQVPYPGRRLPLTEKLRLRHTRSDIVRGRACRTRACAKEMVRHAAVERVESICQRKAAHW